MSPSHWERYHTEKKPIREILKCHPDKNVNLNEEEMKKQAARTRILILAIEDVTSKAKYDNELRSSILTVFLHTAKKSSSSSANNSSGSTPTPTTAASSTVNTAAEAPEASPDKSTKAEEQSERRTGE